MKLSTSIILTAYIFFLIILFISAISCERNKKVVRQPFASETWRQSKGEGRRTMVDNLLDSKFLIGMKRSKVFQILGHPEKEKRCKTFAIIDRTRVAVYFNDNWRVIEVKAMALPSKGTFDERQFDENSWKKGNQADKLAMTRDLIAADYFINKKKEDIAELFGKPIINTHAAIYDLGRKRVFDSSKSALWVYFDNNEIVTEASEKSIF